jgi:hypothetical protein
MPKRWVSRTFRTCVPGIQAAGLATLTCDAHDLGHRFLAEGAVDVQRILATILLTGQGAGEPQNVAHRCRGGKRKGRSAGWCMLLSRAMTSGTA